MKRILMATVALAAIGVGAQQPAATTEQGEPAGVAGGAPVETRAGRMVANALALLAGGEEDRGLGMLEAVPRMFPESQARFRAALAIGQHLTGKRQFDRALAELRRAGGADDVEVQAEAMLRLGQCYLQSGQTGDAMMTLRRVTQDFPTSAFANDAYFAIAQVHFDQGRWAKAAEAFRMVGTAVPAGDVTGQVVRAEAGQRLFVHVSDKDLPVLAQLGRSATVTLSATSGDRETATLEPFGRGDGDYLASVETVPAPSKPDDGRLTVQGHEEITVTYVDHNNVAGSVDSPVRATGRIVSSASLAFMDGAFRQRVRGLFVGQPAFIRLRDLDRDATDAPDAVTVTIEARYQEKPGEGAAADADPAGERPWQVRASANVELTETEARSGVFTGRCRPVLAVEGAEPAAGDIPVQADDRLVVLYSDASHLEGDVPVERTADAVVLVGGSTEPQSIVANASDAAVQGRKLLLEAQLLHKWGGIFKEVGLDGHAAAKAEEGLQRIDEILALAGRFSLARATVEEAFAVKWDLLLVQDRLQAAIDTCRSLVRLYPDTTLADRAFLQIGMARLASKEAGDVTEAIRVFDSLLRLPNSPLKAEAQYRIGEALEKQAKLRTQPGDTPDFASAMVAFRRCAEGYPESAFAGDAFKRIINYYIGTKDYSRAVETLERVFQDYPDAPWLDEMLLKWGVVMHRMGDREQAIAKFRRILEDFPGGGAATQAAAFLERLAPKE